MGTEVDTALRLDPFRPEDLGAFPDLKRLLDQEGVPPGAMEATAYTVRLNGAIIAIGGIVALGGQRGEAWGCVGDVRGRGAAFTRLARAFLRRAMRLAPFNRLQAVAVPGDLRAARWLQVLGFRFEVEADRYWYGAPRDVYVLLRKGP